MVSELRDAAPLLPDEHSLYADELRRRIASIDDSTAVLIPAEDTVARVRKALKNARARTRRG